jgi:hypothetical protein
MIFSRTRVRNARVGSATRSTGANYLTSRAALNSFFATHHVNVILIDCILFALSLSHADARKRTQTTV